MFLFRLCSALACVQFSLHFRFPLVFYGRQILHSSREKKKFVALCAIRSNFYVRKSSKQLMQLTTSTMTIMVLVVNCIKTSWCSWPPDDFDEWVMIISYNEVAILAQVWFCFDFRMMLIWSRWLSSQLYSSRMRTCDPIRTPVASAPGATRTTYAHTYVFSNSKLERILF